MMKRDGALRLTQIDFELSIVIFNVNLFIICYILVNMVANACKIGVQLTCYDFSISTDDVIIFMTGAFLSMGELRSKLYRRNGQSILSG